MDYPALASMKLQPQRANGMMRRCRRGWHQLRLLLWVVVACSWVAAARAQADQKPTPTTDPAEGNTNTVLLAGEMFLHLPVARSYREKGMNSLRSTRSSVFSIFVSLEASET